MIEGLYKCIRERVIAPVKELSHYTFINTERDWLNYLPETKSAVWLRANNLLGFSRRAADWCIGDVPCFETLSWCSSIADHIVKV